MINLLIRLSVKALLSLRYRMRVSGLSTVAERGTCGILFLPNHPALIDPVIVLAQLHRHFAPSALADKDQIDRFAIRWFAKRVGVRPVLDLAKHGPDAREQVEAVVRQCAEGLRGGENILLYPSGHLVRSRIEDLHGNSAVESILKVLPDVRIVLIRTRGLWGSRFSFAAGEFPDLARGLKAAIPILLKNLLLFTPKRDVSLELIEPQDFPRQGDRHEINKFLETVYNDDAPPNTFVPYSIWQRGGTRTLPDPEFGGSTDTAVDIPETTRRLVLEHLREATGIDELSDTAHLARDLGLDSLARAELVIWLGREFGFHTADVAALQTVADVLLAARGQSTATHTVELKPVQARWFAAQSDKPVAAPPGTTINEVFLRQAALRPDAVAVADQTSGVRTYRDLITAVLLLQPIFRKMPGESVAIMLPASVAACIAYLTTLFAGKTPLLINWTTGSRNIGHALELVGAERIVTAAALVTRIESQGTDLSAFQERFVMIESLGGKVPRTRKLAAWALASLSWRRLRRVKPTETAAILLTSGSEALPKAVPLTHANLLANLRDVLKLIDLREHDRMIGFLPPFHSFGLSVTMLLPLAAGVPVVYHANPTEAWTLAQLIESYKATVVIGTPTFLDAIVRAARPGRLATLKLAVTGAEKCPERTYAALAEACPDAIVLEGYGVTECSPIIAANCCDDPRPGTIGRVLASLEHVIVDRDLANRVNANETGMLLVRGPSVFGGYLGPADSPFVEFDGRSWYRTGDLVSEAADGVMTFRGRLKRFVKLGGEMISLPAIEAVLEQHFVQDDGPAIAVEATADESHPEIVLFTTQATDRATVNALLREAQLSPIHNIARVIDLEAIPVLGTGKTDYRSLRKQLSQA